MTGRRIRVALGDLKHGSVGKHSVNMPIGIGCIGAYTLEQLGPQAVEIKLYDKAENILGEIVKWKPHIIGLANYSWNTELSLLVFRLAKKLFPKVICIAGGPEFPLETDDRRAYLAQRPEVDFFVYREGEVAFAMLVRQLLEGADLQQISSQDQAGIAFLHRGSGELIQGEPLPRLTDLDVIPSPYLSGLMDQYFNGHYAPAIETTRGCPFTCAYCVAGNSWFKPLARFSTQRIKDELTYIARRIHKYPEVMLAIYDTNFGMYKRDVDIAYHLSLLQDEFGWPNAFEVTVGKKNMQQILRICTLLKNRMPLAASVQTLNPKTLEVIKRKNLPMSEYYEIQKEIKYRGFLSQTEFIIPLPEETKKSFFNGVRDVIDAGVDVIIPYTCMLLKQTPLASREYRQKYQFQSKFRLIPRQFGEYQEEKCFEIEEVCVATNTLPFADYLDCRGFGFVSSLFSGEQFDFILRHIKELRLNYYDYLMKLWNVVKSGDTITSSIYRRFMEETQQELWESREQLYAYFSQPENYQKLLRGELGDNLVRKYKVQTIIGAGADAFELAYALLAEMGGSLITEEIHQSLQAAKQWVIAVRDSFDVFKNRKYTQD